MTSPRIKPAVFAAAVVAMALADRFDYLPFLATAIQLIAAAICLALVLMRPANEAPVEEAPALNPLGTGLLGALGAIFGVFGWLRSAPGFAHDWKWPLDAAQSHDQLATLASIWLPWGSGAPAVQALGTYPIAMLGWVLGYALPSNLALLTLLGIIGACAGLGTGFLAARVGLSKPYQAVLALAVVAMPVWFNRLNAGHLEWLLGYALFPGALALAMHPGRTLRRAGGLGALWGIAGGQAQFLLFFPLAALPFVMRARAQIAASVGLLLMIGLQIPAIVAMAYGTHVDAFAQQRTNLTWQSAQSDPLALALVSGADAAHYFAHWQSGIGFALAFGAIIFAAIGAFRNALTRTLAAVWLLSAIWSSGLDGPLASPIAWLFTNIPDAIALREFTHAQAITAAAFIILAAAGVAANLRTAKAPSWSGPVLAFFLLLPLTFAAFSGAITRITPPAASSPDREAVVNQIDALPESGQILWWPGLPPVSFANSRGGVDSEAFVTGRHAPYAEYRPTAALAQAIVALNASDRAACGLFAGLGIQAIVVRDGTTIPSGAAFSSLSVPSAQTMQRAGLREIATEGPYHLYAVPCYRGRFTLASDATITGDWSSIVPIARRRGATDELTNDPAPPIDCTVVPFDAASYESTDVAREWVPLSALDRLFLNFDNAFDDVFVTRDASLRLTTWALAAPADAPYTWMPPQRANRLLPRGLAVWRLARCPDGVRPTKSTVAISAISNPFSPGTFVLLRPSIIVAHYGRDAGWSLVVNGEPAPRPELADGFATGWVLRPGQWRLALVPSGPPMGLLWTIVVLAGAMCLVLMLLTFPHRSR
jgi:hypothetical protein